MTEERDAIEARGLEGPGNCASGNGWCPESLLREYSATLVRCIVLAAVVVPEAMRV